MAKTGGLVEIVGDLKAERKNLLAQLRHVDAALSVLGKLDGGSSYTAPRSRFSAAARRKMSLAQKARWAKVAPKVKAPTVKPTRIMSASARRKIAATQRARWAKIRAAKKATP